MATIVFRVTKNITPAPVIMSRVERTVYEESFLLSRRFVAEHNVRVSTWNDKPAFSGEASDDLGPEKPNVLIVVNGSDLQVKKWFWVDKGTAVRYAQLSQDWASKTQPGQRVPGPGQGRVLYVDRNIAWPGIDARKFSEDIVDDLSPEAVAHFRRGFVRGLNGSPLSIGG